MNVPDYLCSCLRDGCPICDMRYEAAPSTPPPSETNGFTDVGYNIELKPVDVTGERWKAERTSAPPPSADDRARAERPIETLARLLEESGARLTVPVDVVHDLFARLTRELAEAREALALEKTATDRANQDFGLAAQALAEAREDRERLDWLERRRQALNDHYQTEYGWKFVTSHNVNRLFVRDTNTLDLNDAEPRGGDIRAAIDAARKERG